MDFIKEREQNRKEQKRISNTETNNEFTDSQRLPLPMFHTDVIDVHIMLTTMIVEGVDRP